MLPVATPVTTPASTVALPVAEEFHVPPEGEPVRVMVLPTVTAVAPEMVGFEVQSPAATVTDCATDDQHFPAVL